MKPDEDCMGNPTPGYWRCFETCSDGCTVIGTGQTEDEALLDATIKRNYQEDYLRLPSIERLKILLAGDLLSTASKEALKIIGKLVIDLCEKAHTHG